MALLLHMVKKSIWKPFVLVIFLEKYSKFCVVYTMKSISFTWAQFAFQSVSQVIYNFINCGNYIFHNIRSFLPYLSTQCCLYSLSLFWLSKYVLSFKDQLKYLFLFKDFSFLSTFPPLDSCITLAAQISCICNTTHQTHVLLELCASTNFFFLSVCIACFMDLVFAQCLLKYIELTHYYWETVSYKSTIFELAMSVFKFYLHHTIWFDQSDLTLLSIRLLICKVWIRIFNSQIYGPN